MELVLPFFVPDCVYRFKMICLIWTYVTERNPEIFAFFWKSTSITLEQKKCYSLKQKVTLPFIFLDFVYKFHMICYRKR